MDITFISDTHRIHDELKLRGGKVLIHAGDITEYGTEEEVIDSLRWFSKQPFIYRIFIGGNHDLFLEESTVANRNKVIPAGIIYLENSGVEIDSLKIWGSPVTPYFLGMAFNVTPGKDIKKIWDKIPNDIVILITHGPPKGLLDADIGCEGLWERINRVRPLIHCFGHAHGVNGVLEKNGTTYINSVLVNSLDPLKNDEYKLVDKPIPVTL